VLVIPHHIMLASLWLGFVLVSAVALVAILVTRPYPRAIFDRTDRGTAANCPPQWQGWG